MSEKPFQKKYKFLFSLSATLLTFHLILGISRRLPLSLYGFHFTEQINLIGIFFWILLILGLIYFRWFKK